MGLRARLLLALALAACVAAPAGALGENADVPSPPEASPQLQAEVERAIEAVAGHEAWLKSPEAEAEREASRDAYLALGKEEARELLEREFAEALEATEVTNLLDPGRVLDYLDANTVLLGGDGEPRAIAESGLPLLAIDESGAERPLDLSLSEEGGRLEAANPLVGVSLPEHLGGEIKLGGEGGIGITSKLANPDSRVVQVGDAGALYANAGEARDLLVTTQPSGIELSTQVRSLEAPEEERYGLDLPEGAALAERADGSIAIVRGEEVLGRISTPIAEDSQGQRVPVSLRAEGDAFVVEADFRGGDYALPLLIDPFVDLYTYQSGAFSTAYWPPYQTPGSPFLVCPGGPPNDCNWLSGRIWINSPTGTYASFATGEKKWTVPNGTANPDGSTAWIESVIFGTVVWSGTSAQPYQPLFVVGIWNPRTASWSAQSVYLGNQPLSGAQLTLTPSGSGAADSERISFQLLDWTGSTTTHSGIAHAYADSATISITDPEAPSQTITANTFPATGWVRQDPSPLYSLTAAANDPGLGIKSIRLYKPKVGGTIDLGEPASYELHEQFPSPACTGGRMAPCPQNLTKTFSYATATMPEGRHKLFIESWDPLAGDHVDKDTAEVRIDRTAPTLELSGSLTEAEGGDLADRNYELKITARDGSAESPDQERSGVKDIQVLLDGQQVAYQQQSCSTGSCEQELTYQLNAASLSAGPTPSRSAAPTRSATARPPGSFT